MNRKTKNKKIVSDPLLAMLSDPSNSANISAVDSKNEIVGACSGLKFVMERVGLVAPLNVPVLLLGDTGTGKEVIARAIHSRSPRHNGPFLRVNCGAIPGELIDSQLFGHEKGSFTGAGEQHHGWFERADGGTLFLDEIGELPLAAQVRFLRVLQDQQFERVGGRNSVKINVRIVAATHRDLTRMVHNRTFREDLWFRINVFPILIPPLSDRLADIGPLACHFARRAANRFGLNFVEPSEKHIQLLEKYDWPGNIRELQAVIDRAAILGNGRTLEIEKALGVQGHQPSSTRQSVDGIQEDGNVSHHEGELLKLPRTNFPTLDEVQRQHIILALKQCFGRVDGRYGAACLLGINPHTLRARMRKLSVDWKDFRNGIQPSK